MTEENLLQAAPAETPVSPAMGVAMIALNMALKYHDITTVQDGTLYQQYKLEGHNLPGLHLDMVFETARRIERHLLISANAISDMMVNGVMEAIAHVLDEDEEGEPPEDGSADAAPEGGAQ